MADEFGTFSAIVDGAVSRTGRLDRQTDGSMAAWLRLAMHAVQAGRLYQKDMVEDSIDVTVDPYVWVKPAGFTRILLATPGDLTDLHNNRREYVVSNPSRMQKRVADYYYYETGDSVVFTGHGTGTHTIKLAYFKQFLPLVYYAVGARPATYNRFDGWVYDAAYDTTDDQRTAARELVSNWLTLSYHDQLIEGIIARYFQETNDERQRTAYSLWNNEYLPQIRSLAGTIHVPMPM